MRGALRRMVVVASLAAAFVTASASPAGAALTVGQTGPPSFTCSGTFEWLVPPGNLGNSYVVPPLPPAEALSITSWSHQAGAGAGQKLKLKVFRPVSGLNYTVVGQDVFRDVAASVLNTFTTSISVKPGDIVGITTVSGGGTIGCGIPPAGQPYQFTGGDYPNGAPVTFMNATGQRLNVSAVVEPTNSFSLGRTTRNKKKGTATLALNVPNPGEVVVSGKGAKEASAADLRATTAKSVVAGAVKLKIKAKGQKLKKLDRTGKVKLTPTITYTPTAGSPSAQSTKLKLKKR
jgi:hypothetical protein